MGGPLVLVVRQVCLGRMEPLTNPGLPVTLWRAGAAYFVRGQRSRAGMARNVFTPPFKDKQRRNEPGR